VAARGHWVQDWAHRWALGFFFYFFVMINRGGRPNVPASVNQFIVAGTGDRHGKSTINRDLRCVAGAFACNTPGVCHLLSTRFELKHDKFNGNKEVKVNL